MKLFLPIAVTLLTTLNAQAQDRHTIMTSPAPVCEADDPSCLVLEQNQTFELADWGALDFIGIAEDSRCPLDVFCFWEGRVRVELKHQGLTSSQKFEVGLGGNLKPEWIDEESGIKLILEQVWPDKLLLAPSDEPYRIKLKIEQAKPVDESSTLGPDDQPLEPEDNLNQQSLLIVE